MDRPAYDTFAFTTDDLFGSKHAFVAAIVLQITRSVVHKVTCDIWQSKQEALGQTPETRRVKQQYCQRVANLTNSS